MNFESTEVIGAALFVASAKGEPETLKQILIDHNEIINLVIDYHEEGWTPLMKSAASGNHQVVRLLCEAGANINFRNKEGYTSLIVASAAGHIPVIKELFAFGADLNIQDEDGATALLWGCRQDAFAAQMLIGLGADANISDDTGLTPLMVAVCNNQHETVRLLIIHQADINAVLDDGTSALQVAIAENNLPLIHMLILAGANYSIERPQLDPSFNVAIESDTSQARQILECILNHQSSAEKLALVGIKSPCGSSSKLHFLIEEYIRSQQEISFIQSRLQNQQILSNDLEVLSQKLTHLGDERDKLRFELKILKEELAYAEEESSFMCKELANAKISIEDYRLRNDRMG